MLFPWRGNVEVFHDQFVSTLEAILVEISTTVDGNAVLILRFKTKG